MDPAVTHYLKNYAEPEVQALAGLTTPLHDFALTIPAYDECYDFLTRLNPLLQRNSCLVIVVINQPDSLPSPCSGNRQLLSDIHNKLALLNTCENVSLFQFKATESHLLVVDRFSQGLTLPRKQGVGLARKIAADIAASLIVEKVVKYPWIYSTDCDAHLPEDYFSAATQLDAPACLYPFIHDCADNKLGVATRLYEYSLNYYQQGLQWAGSPYAFHTLGSTLAIRLQNYCQVRGFPKRSGGEDFYLINKLAKTGSIVQLSKPQVILSARNSHRVPFGTGPAVTKIMALQNPQKEFTVYHPKCFFHLKQLLDAIKQLADNPDKSLDPNLASNSLFYKNAATTLGLQKALLHANKHSSTPQQFLRHFHTWFDAFRTLRFIHLLRDAGLHNVMLNCQKPPWETPERQ